MRPSREALRGAALEQRTLPTAIAASQQTVTAHAAPSAERDERDHRKRGTARAVSRNRADGPGSVAYASVRASSTTSPTDPAPIECCDESPHLQGKGRGQDATVHLALQEQAPRPADREQSTPTRNCARP